MNSSILASVGWWREIWAISSWLYSLFWRCWHWILARVPPSIEFLLEIILCSWQLLVDFKSSFMSLSLHCCLKQLPTSSLPELNCRKNNTDQITYELHHLLCWQWTKFLTINAFYVNTTYILWLSTFSVNYSRKRK